MQTIEVKFSEEDKNKLINQICEEANKESKCYNQREYKNGWTLVFENVVDSGLTIFATVLINDSYVGYKQSRYSSTDIKLLEHGVEVKSNLNYEFEDAINKALIAIFRS